MMRDEDRDDTDHEEGTKGYDRNRPMSLRICRRQTLSSEEDIAHLPKNALCIFPPADCSK